MHGKYNMNINIWISVVINVYYNFNVSTHSCCSLLPVNIDFGKLVSQNLTS